MEGVGVWDVLGAAYLRSGPVWSLRPLAAVYKARRVAEPDLHRERDPHRMADRFRSVGLVVGVWTLHFAGSDDLPGQLVQRDSRT